MTQRSRTYLKGVFEQGDIPTGTDYADLIDSFLSLETSSEQTMIGGLTLTSVNATNGRIDNLSVTTKVTAAAAEFTGPVSAASIWVDSKLIQSNQINVSANGTTQAAATRLTKDTSYVFCTNLNRAVVLATAEPGRTQIIVNTATTALLVFPASGANFVGTAENASLALAANGTMIVPHIGVSAYGMTRTQGV
jgi:hypothetical protein